jgi:uncharacterized membrane protein
LCQRLNLAFQGFIRILLGVLFGVLLTIAVYANIVPGIIHGNYYSLFVFGVVAGLSERFVPDILNYIATEKPKNEST